MSLPAWHRAKIVCTLGPATDNPGIVAKLIRAGMDVVRVNMSHGSHADHARRIALIRNEARMLGQPVAILADLPGPKFRLGQLAGGALTLHEGSAVTLTVAVNNPAALPVRNAELLAALHHGESVYLADGSVELRVIGSGSERVDCEVVIGGVVRSGSGINVLEADFGALVPMEDDRRHLAFALSQSVEWIGVSFVQTADDLARVRECSPAGTRALLMAKIEKRRALAELDSIIDAADGVMVARGDLGVETDLAEIPLVQKRVIAAANARGRPVVTATQMLESMIEHERPTRAEVTDVANAVLDGTDAVMLSGETAVGRHPVAAVEILNRVLSATEAEHAARIAAQRLQTSAVGPGDSLGFAACQLSARVGASAIIASVHDLAAAAAIARFRPAAPLLMVTDSESLWRALAVVCGVAPIYSEAGVDPRSCVTTARKWLLQRGLVAEGDGGVLLFASAPHITKPDTLQIVRF